MDNETESAGAPPHLRRNVLAWLLWCLLWSAGGRLMALGSVLPALASLLTPSKLAIGLLGSADLLRLPTQLLSAWLIRSKLLAPEKPWICRKRLGSSSILLCSF